MGDVDSGGRAFVMNAIGNSLMLKRRISCSVIWPILLVNALCPELTALIAATNPPPDVSIEWPRPGYSFGAVSTSIKIKANVASNASACVTQVQFYVETGLIGTVTNAPFNLVWQVWLPGEDSGDFDLRAVATDSFGSTATSAPVNFRYSTTQPTIIVVEMLRPPDGSVFAAPATFVFSAEVFATEGDAGPIEFFCGRSFGRSGQRLRIPKSNNSASIHCGEQFG